MKHIAKIFLLALFSFVLSSNAEFEDCKQLNKKLIDHLICNPMIESFSYPVHRCIDTTLIATCTVKNIAGRSYKKRFVVTKNRLICKEIE